MATISNTPRPGYVWDSTDNVWYPIGVGGHSHSEIASTIADAKGDLIAGTAADAVARLAVGTNNHTLIADSAEVTGLKYAAGSKATLTTTGDILYASAANTPARLGIGSASQVLSVSGGIPAWTTPASGSAISLVAAQAIGSAVSSVTVTNAFSTTYDSYRVILSGCTSSVASGNGIKVTLGSVSTGYYYAGVFTSYNSTVSGLGGSNVGFWLLGSLDNGPSNLTMDIFSPFLATPTYFSGTNNFTTGRAGSVNGAQSASTSHTNLTLTPEGGTFTGGTLYVYGYAKV